MTNPRFEIVVATKNPNKIKEMARIFEGVSLDEIALTALPTDAPEVIEDRDDFLGNALKKAVEMSQFTGKPALSEDSGLVVDALDGAPGVYSARYAGTARSDADNNEKLVASLEATGATPPFTARYVAVLCLAIPREDALAEQVRAQLGQDEVWPGVPETAGVLGEEEGMWVAHWRGEVEGEIVSPGRGAGGFGYDPHFLVPAYGETMASMSAEQKSEISHRGRAIRAMASALSGRHE